MANAVHIQVGSHSHIRRVVATTLKQWFEDETVLEAICVVEHLFARADASNFGVIAIVKALSEHFGWSQQMRHDARLSLYKNMLPGAALVPDPKTQLLAFKKQRNLAAGAEFPRSAPMAANQGDAHNDDSVLGRANFVVFSQLIYSLRKLIVKNYASHYPHFSEMVKQEIAELNIGPHVEPWVDRVLGSAKEGILNITLLEQQMADIVHAFYNAISETIGPMDADTILTRAISLTERTQAAEHFSPKKFL